MHSNQSARSSPRGWHPQLSHVLPWVLVLVAVLLAGVFGLVSWEWLYIPRPSDVDEYFRYANSFAGGQLPYRDFQVEYPPLALVWFFLPRALATDFLQYRSIFKTEMFLLAVAGAWLLMRVVARIGEARPPSRRLSRALAAYVLTLLAIGPLVAERFDLAPAVFVLAALDAWTARRRKLGWVFVALGTATKIYPAVLAPLFLIALIRERRFRDVASGVASFLLTLVCAGLPFLALSPGGFADSFLFQFERGIQLESLYGNIVLVASKHGLGPVNVVHNFGAFHVESPWSVPMVLASGVLTVAVFLAIYLTYYKASAAGREERYYDELLLAFAPLAVAAFILAGKVLSPQFIIWLATTVPLAACIRSRHSMRERLFIYAGTALVVAAGLSQWIFPHWYPRLIAIEDRLVFLLTLRNALLLLLFGLLVWNAAVLVRNSGYSARAFRFQRSMLRTKTAATPSLDPVSSREIARSAGRR